MEEKVLEILKEIEPEIITYEGDNLFDAGLLDSYLVISLVAELEDAFNIEIDAEYVVEENFQSKESIITLIKEIAKEA